KAFFKQFDTLVEWNAGPKLGIDDGFRCIGKKDQRKSIELVEAFAGRSKLLQRLGPESVAAHACAFVDGDDDIAWRQVAEREILWGGQKRPRECDAKQCDNEAANEE